MEKLNELPDKGQKFIVRQAHQITALGKFIRRFAAEKPLEVSIKYHDPNRTIDQNSLFHVIYKQVADWVGDHTMEEIAAISKLEVGIPLIKERQPELAEEYEFLDYIVGNERFTATEIKTQIMKQTAVTRRFKKATGTAYIDALCRYWSEKRDVIIQLPGDR